MDLGHGHFVATDGDKIVETGFIDGSDLLRTAKENPNRQYTIWTKNCRQWMEAFSQEPETRATVNTVSSPVWPDDYFDALMESERS